LSLADRALSPPLLLEGLAEERQGGTILCGIELEYFFKGGGMLFEGL
jgi:hypothetical protein